MSGRGLPKTLASPSLAAGSLGGWLLSSLLANGCSPEPPPLADDTDLMPFAAVDGSPTTDDGAIDGGPGTAKGQVVLTYYWVTAQSDYSGADDTVLCDDSAKTLATVPLAFAKALALEGTGRLRDGRLLNISSSCACPSGMRSCYAVLDPAKYPFGEGVGGRALRPYRSIAVDKSFFSIGAKVYVPAFAGQSMPASYGFVHDGCLSADDVGGGITGAHIDWFVAEKANYRTLDGQLKLSQVAAYVNSPHCP